ncbi:hypothetical protein BD779DRAFT_1502823 [Infundibulicybe gibba]|nr:hypothetical protein BD779DRAFT_1502823 [Infundibulicybe gibba]
MYILFMVTPSAVSLRAVAQPQSISPGRASNHQPMSKPTQFLDIPQNPSMSCDKLPKEVSQLTTIICLIWSSPSCDSCAVLAWFFIAKSRMYWVGSRGSRG